MQAQTSRGHIYGRAWRVSSHNQHDAIMLSSGEPALHLVSPNSYSLFRDIGKKKVSVVLGTLSMMCLQDVMSKDPEMSDFSVYAARSKLSDLPGSFISWLTTIFPRTVWHECCNKALIKNMINLVLVENAHDVLFKK